MDSAQLDSALYGTLLSLTYQNSGKTPFTLLFTVMKCSRYVINEIHNVDPDPESRWNILLTRNRFLPRLKHIFLFFSQNNTHPDDTLLKDLEQFVKICLQ